MKSFIIGAVLLSAFANGAVVRRADGTGPDDCKESVPQNTYGLPPATSGNGVVPQAGKTGSGSPNVQNPSGTTNSATGDKICGGYDRIETVTIGAGQTLAEIAGKKVGVCDLAKLNGITNINYIQAGHQIKFPVGCKRTKDTTTCAPKPPPATEIAVLGLPSAYTVVKGDTLTAVAADFNITLPGLLSANPKITNPDAIDVGQVVNVPVYPSSQCDVLPYKIKSGDVYVDLATKHSSTVGQIKSLNPTKVPEKLAVDEIIILPTNCRNVTASH